MVFIKQNLLNIFQISFYFLKETNINFKRNLVNWWINKLNVKKILIFYFAKWRTFAECLITTPSYLQLLVLKEEVLTKVTLLRFLFKEDKIILYDDSKIIKVNDYDLLLNVEFQREVVGAMSKKVEYEQEIDDLVETNLW